MKKITLSIMTALVLLSFMPVSLHAAIVGDPIKSTITHKVVPADAVSIRFRLAEIKAVDKSELSSAQRKQLKKEARSLKSDLRQISGGVYLSTGAIILVVILLILLL
jgi:hypothetical protein